jgi:hypothetical protein
VHLVAFPVAPDDVLEGGRHEEVLLGQPEFAPHEDIVVGVEHPANSLGVGAGLDGAHVVALVELAEVELLHRAGAPEAQGVHGRGRVAGDGSVVRGGEHVAGIDPGVAQAAALVRVRVDAAVELHAEAVAHPGNLPGIAVPEPAVGHLDLGAVDDALVEDAVVVAQAVAVGGIAEGREGVEEARGEAAEAAVAQPGERLPARVAKPQGLEAIAERPPHQVLEREVVDALGVLVVIRVLRPDPALDEPVADGQRQRHVWLPFAVDMPGELGQRVLEVLEEALPEGGGVHPEAGTGQVLARSGDGGGHRGLDRGHAGTLHKGDGAALDLGAYSHLLDDAVTGACRAAWSPSGQGA